MAQKYMVHVRLSEFLTQCLHHYSKKTGMTNQSIMTESLDRFMNEKLTSDEYRELLQFTQKKEKTIDTMNKKINEDWFEYLDSLPEEKLKFFDDVYKKCYEAYMEAKKTGKSFNFKDVDGYNNLKVNEKDRLRISIIAEYFKETSGKKHHPDDPIDFETYIKAWDTAFKLKEKEEPKDKNVKKK